MLANPLAERPSSSASCVFPSSQMSDARRQISFGCRVHQIRSGAPNPPSPSPCCSSYFAGACKHGSSRQTAVREGSSVPGGTRCREPKPVPAPIVSSGSINHVTDACIQVESSKNPVVHPSFDRIAGAAIRRRVQIQHGAPMLYSNQSSREISAALCSMFRTFRFTPSLSLAAGTPCKVKSMSMVDRAALNRNSSA